MNPKDKLKIKMPKKGTEVDTEEYLEISAKKTNEMREMFRKRRESGGSRRVN